MDELRAKLDALKTRREKLVHRYCICGLAELAIMVLTAPFPGLTTLSMVLFALLLLALPPILIVNAVLKSNIKKLESSFPPQPDQPAPEDILAGLKDDRRGLL